MITLLGKKELVALPFFGLWHVYCLFVCVEVLRPSQPNGVMSSAVSLPNHTFTGQALSSKRLTSIVHILSPETDNCPSWISGRKRMTVENISWSISTKECCRPRRGSNPRPPGLQSDAHPTEPPRPAGMCIVCHGLFALRVWCHWKAMFCNCGCTWTFMLHFYLPWFYERLTSPYVLRVFNPCP